jgi:hypothetical protein
MAMDAVRAVARYESDVNKHVLIFANGLVKDNKAGIGLTVILRTAHILSHY